MLKGVNRQVLEILQPDCDYFEKVIFFVKPEYYGMSEAKLREKAASVLKKTLRPPKYQTGFREARLANALRFLLAAGIGGMIVFALQLVIR